MAIYEYACEKCTKIVEVIHKHDETPKIICKECSEDMHRIMSLGGFRLKGDGWTIPKP